MNPGTDHSSFLASLDPSAAAALISTAADVALLVDKGGVIRDVNIGSAELEPSQFRNWIGHPWIETVTVESQNKVRELMKDAGPNRPTAWRHLNHPSGRGADVPVLYSAARVGARGDIIVIGRSLKSAAVLQQRLVEAQQSLERDYLRMRQAETRYRLLFQASSEAILVVDAGSRTVVEANAAAVRLLGDGARSLSGRPFPSGFDETGTQAITALLAALLGSGRTAEVRARPAGRPDELLLNASLFRQDGNSFFLLRLLPGDSSRATAARASIETTASNALERLPDGFALTDPDGRVLWANLAFLEMVQLAGIDQARGRSLEDWLGRGRVDLNVLTANLRQHESVRLFATTMVGDLGSESQAEISAVSLPDPERPALAFAVRGTARRLGMTSTPAQAALPRSVEQWTDMIGRVPLRDIVRDTVDVIERLCIESALRLTGDNRASAAEMLGLSRQSLYAKLHRYGMVDSRDEA